MQLIYIIQCSKPIRITFETHAPTTSQNVPLSFPWFPRCKLNRNLNLILDSYFLKPFYGTQILIYRNSLNTNQHIPRCARLLPMDSHATLQLFLTSLSIWIVNFMISNLHTYTLPSLVPLKSLATLSMWLSEHISRCAHLLLMHSHRSQCKRHPILVRITALQLNINWKYEAMS